MKMNQIEQYYETDALSQSMMKALFNGIGTFKKEERDAFLEDPEHFIIGGAVDVMLTDEERFGDLYYISQLDKKPSKVIMGIIRESFSTSATQDIDQSRRRLWEVINAREYYMNRAKPLEEDTRIDEVIKKGKDYWDELIAAGSRVILDAAELELVQTISTSLKTHIHTRKYFEGKQILTQVPLYWTYKGVPCKGLLDMVIIDGDELIPIDIKTIGDSTKAFPKSVRRLRYDLQAAWYTFGLTQVKSIQINELQSIDLSKFKVKPFRFLVESTTSPGILPLEYRIDSTDYAIARYGAIKHLGRVDITKEGHWSASTNPNFYITQRIKGFEEGVDLYKWHLEHGFDLDKDIAEAKGVMPLRTWN